MEEIIQMPTMGTNVYKTKLPACLYILSVPSYPLSSSTGSSTCVWLLSQPRFEFSIVTKVIPCHFSLLPPRHLSSVLYLPNGWTSVSPGKERHIAYNSIPFHICLTYLASIAFWQCSIFVWRRVCYVKDKNCSGGCDLGRDSRDCVVKEPILDK